MAGISSTTVLGMTLPHVFSTPRLSTVYADVPTAVANPFLLQNVDWSNPNPSAERMIPKGQFYMAISRSPLQALVRFYEYLENELSYYRFYFATPSQTTTFSGTYRFDVNQPGGVSFPYDVNLVDTPPG